MSSWPDKCSPLPYPTQVIKRCLGVPGGGYKGSPENLRDPWTSRWGFFSLPRQWSAYSMDVMGVFVIESMHLIPSIIKTVVL